MIDFLQTHFKPYLSSQLNLFMRLQLTRKMRLKTGESEQEPVAALHSPGVVAVLQCTVASILVAAAVAAGYYLICIIRENLHYIIQHCIALFAVHT